MRIVAYDLLKLTSIYVASHIHCRNDFFHQGVDAIKVNVKKKDKVKQGIIPSVKFTNFRRCEVELKFTVHYLLFGPNSEL